MNKKKIDNVILGILTFVLIVYLSLSLVFFGLFNISKKIFNKNDILEFINDIDIIEILKNEFVNEFKSIDLIKNELFNIGITEQGLNEFISSSDVKKYSNNTINKVINKVLNKSNIDYKIDSYDITTLVENNIDKLNIDTNISSDKLLKKIENKIPALTNNINNLLDSIFEKIESSQTVQKYNNYVLSFVDIFDIMYSNIVLGIIVFVIISLIFLLIFIRKNIEKSLKWLSIGFIIPTVIFGIISIIICSFIKLDNILIKNIFNLVNKDLINYSFIFFIIALLLVVINIILVIKKKNEVYDEQK